MTYIVEGDLNKIKSTIEVDLELGAEDLYFYISTLDNSNLRIEASHLLYTAQRKSNERELDELKVALLELLNEVEIFQSSKDENEVSKTSIRADFFVNSNDWSIDNSVVVKAENLKFQYKPKKVNGRKIEGFSLEGINFELRLGEITGVTGKNAYGKSTLFRMLSGELKHDSGSLNFPKIDTNKSKHINWPEVKRHIAYVPQSLKPWYGTLEENIRYQAAIKGIRGKENDIEFDYIVQRLGLSNYLHQTWRELSGGYKLRFELAKALIWKPTLLILDEPLANLDYDAQIIVLKDLRSFVDSYRSPKSIIMSTQHLHEVEAVADRILFLKEGRQESFGKISEIGRKRAYNAFEISTKIPAEVLEHKLLSNKYVNSIRDNMVNQVIFTSPEFDREDCIKLLQKNEVSFHYFRDISQSIKYLMEGYTQRDD